MTDPQTHAADRIEGAIKKSYRNAPSRLHKVDVTTVYGGDIDVRVTLTEAGSRPPPDLMKSVIDDVLDLFKVPRFECRCGHDHDGLVYAKVKAFPPDGGWPSKEAKQ